MKTLRRTCQFLLCFLLYVNFVNAQLTVTGGQTAQQLAEILAGPNIVVSNATITGNVDAYGAFQAVGSNLNVNSGVILATGHRNNAIGPNNDPGTSTNFNAPGSALLDQVAAAQTFDAVTLEFDFTVETDFIQFNYVFASEEYPEFAPPNTAAFNDVFAFYISGPGITGQENIALVPNTTTPVSINNINPITYWQYYVDNNNGATVQYDGFTTVLTARRDSLIPCETYTLTLAIADAGDGIYDSGVFLQENSLVQGTVSAITNTVSGDSVALEGCIQASFTFNMDTTFSVPTDIHIGIGGSATNGVDYAYIDSVITIPAGQSAATIIIDAFADGLTEGQEVIELYFESEPCGPIDTVRLYIDDNTSIGFTSASVDVACAGDSTGQINLNITGGTPAYTVILNGVDTFQTANIVNLPAGTYGIEIIDLYGCGAEALTIGGSYNAGATFIPDGQGGVYTTTIPISGFQAGQTLTDMNQIQFACVSLEHSFMGDIEIRLYAPNGSYIILKQRPGGANGDFGEPVANGQVDTNNPDTTQGVCYNYCFTMNAQNGTMVDEITNNTHTYTDVTGTVLTDNYLPAGSYLPYQSFAGLLGTPMNGNWTIWVKDYKPNDNGWICDWSISLTTDNEGDTVTIEEPDPIVLTGVVTDASCGSSNGSIDLTVNGTFSPFTYAWSHGPSSEDVTGLSAGSYTVTVTDQNGCSNDTTFLVQNTGGGFTLSTAFTQVTCPGAANGTIDLTVNGGSGSQTYAWSTGASTEDLSGLAPGTYTVTVTDAGCQSLATVTVTQVPAITLSAVTTNEHCGDAEGVINLTVNGGTGPFAYNWSNGTSLQDPTDLIAGTYSVTVTDANGCTQTGSWTLINEVGNCVTTCDLAITFDQVSDENCGDGQGAINITGFTSAQPITYAWSTGATTQDINGLNAGTYTVTLSDANSCTVTQSWTVNNQTTGLSIVGTNATDENCGNGQGAVDLSVTGGAMPYTYSWSNGVTTQDLTGISAGTYTVTVTDNNGCMATTSATVNNITGTLVQTYGNAVDESCGNGAGSIDITIAGGNQPYTYNWSNGANTQDLMNLSAGTYTCTITDQNGCMLVTPTYTVNNLSGTLAITNIDADNEICGNGEGDINITVTGGTAPLSYLWNTGAMTEDLATLSAGVYSMTVTDGSGCSVSTGNITIVDEPGTLSMDNVQVFDEVCGNGQGAINITVTGGDMPYSYQWNTGSTSQDLYGLSAGNYDVTVTDINGCEVTANGVVNNDAGSLSILNAVVNDETCGNGTGAIDIYPDGGAAPVAYTWSNGGNTEDLTGLNAGNYTVTITDNNGCATSATYTVGNDAGSLQMSSSAVTNETCGNAGGAVDISVAGGTGPYTYAWSNGATTQDLTGVSAGTYTVTITDGASCVIVQGPFTVNNGAGTLAVSSLNGTNETCGNGSGAADLTVTGGTGAGTYTYNWSNGAMTEDLTGLSAGTYTVTITDGNGCTKTSSVTITDLPGTLSFDSYAITDETCGNTGGAVDITVSGGAGPYTYNWSNAAVTEDISGLSAGSYTVTITDQNGCTQIQGPFTVTNQPGTLSLNQLNTTNENCGDGQGAVTAQVSGGTAPLTYAWNTGANTTFIDGLNAGVYTVTITDANGCSITASAAVQNNPGALTVLTDSVWTENCGGDDGAAFITLIGGTNPVSYTWSNGGTTDDITGLQAGTYTVLITDGAGCSTTETVTVPGTGQGFSLPLASVTDVECGVTDGVVNISVTGGGVPYTYSWSNGETTEDISGLQAGWYYVTVTDASGCTLMDSAFVDNITVGPAASNVDICGPGNVVLTASGGSNYVWYDAATGGNQLGTGPSFSTSVNGDTTFYVSTTTSAGSQYVGPAGPGALGFGGYYNQAFPQYLEFDVLTDMRLISVLVDADGAGNRTIEVWDDFGVLLWDTTMNIANGQSRITLNHDFTPGSYRIGGSNMALYRNLQGAVYPYTLPGVVSITNNSAGGPRYYFFYDWEVQAGGCESQRTAVDVTVNPVPTATLTPAGPTSFCYGDDVTLNAAGGDTYLWSTGSAATSIVADTTGDYYVIAYNTFGCTDTSAVQSVVSHIPTAEITSSGPLTVCLGQTVTLNANTGSNYSWSTTESTQSIVVNTTGDYWVSLLDSNGCAASDTVTVNVTNTPTATITPSGSLDICPGTSVNLTATQGSTYQWSGGQATQTISVGTAGTYEVTVTFPGGCADTATAVTVAVYPQPVPGITAGGPTTFCDGDSVMLSGTGGASYDWSTGDMTQDITVYTAGVYQVVITDTNGCQDSTTASVNVNPLPTVNITGDTVYCEGSSTVLTASGGTGYSWSSGDNTAGITVTIPGGYTVTVTDGNGCESSASVNVTENPSPTAGFNTNTNLLTASFTNTSTGGTSSSWDFGDGATAGSTNANHTYSAPGTYTVTLIVTNSFGCSDTATTSVTVTDVAITDGLEGIFIEGIYPNPFSESFHVDLMIDRGNELEVELYDLYGRKIGSLYKGYAAPGLLKLEWQADRAYAQGTYMLKIRFGDRVLHHKLVHNRY